MKTNSTRGKTYLTVPFAEKDEAKDLGAKWDPDIKRWFVPMGFDVSDFSRWLPTDESRASER